MSTADKAKKELEQLVITFVEESPRGRIMAGCARETIRLMGIQGLMPQIDDILNRMKKVGKLARTQALMKVINHEVEFFGFYGQIKLPPPVPESMDRLDELIAQTS